MNPTLVFYSSVSREKDARIVAGVIGNAKYCTAQNAPEQLTAYRTICLIAEKEPVPEDTALYLRNHGNELAAKQVAVIAPECTENELTRAVSLLQKECGGPFAPIIALTADGQKGLIAAAGQTAHVFHQAEKPLDKAALLNHIEDFLRRHTTCALATGAGAQVRCTPLEYRFSLGTLYIVTEGGQKYGGLLQNPTVSLAVYDSYTDMKHLAGLQITATAAELDPRGKEYEEQLAVHKMTPEQAEKLPVDLHILAVKPQSYELLDSSLAAKGFDINQSITL